MGMTTFAIATETAPVVHGPPQGHWTYADWEKLGADGNRYEIIDGVLYMTTAPSSFHQWIIQQLVEYIGIPVKRQGLAYAFPAPIGLLMTGSDPVQPDYVIVLKAHASIIHDRRIRGVPDAIIEILSPGNATYDEETKLQAYEHAGVPEYVIIDPRSQTLRHYRRDTPSNFTTPRLIGSAETFAFECLPTIRFQVSDLFAGAPDTTV